MTANGSCFISTLNYHRYEKCREMYTLYVLDCWAFSQLSAKDPEINDWEGVQHCSFKKKKKNFLWICGEMKDWAGVSIPKQKGWALK